MLTDDEAKKEYYRSQGLSSVDVGSRLALIHVLKPKVKKKSGLYKLKKNQLKSIYSKV